MGVCNWGIQALYIGGWFGSDRLQARAKINTQPNSEQNPVIDMLIMRKQRVKGLLNKTKTKPINGVIPKLGLKNE